MTVDCVFDTSALCAYHLKEPGSDVVEQFLKNSIKVMHRVNIAEFCFSFSKQRPKTLTPKIALDILASQGISGVDILDDEIVALTAEIRLQAPALSIGDGFAVALASICAAPVITADKAFLRAADFAQIEVIR